MCRCDEASAVVGEFVRIFLSSVVVDYVMLFSFSRSNQSRVGELTSCVDFRVWMS